jgi:hypothetical protein
MTGTVFGVAARILLLIIGIAVSAAGRTPLSDEEKAEKLKALPFSIPGAVRV